MTPGQGDDSSNLYFQADLKDNVSPTADQIEQRLKKLGASKHEIQIFLKAYDQASDKIKQAQDKLKHLPKEHIINIKANTDSLNSAQKQVSKLRELAKSPITLTLKAKNDIQDHFQSFKQKIPVMEMELRNALRNAPLTAGLLGGTAAAYNVVSGPLSGATGLPFASLGAGGAALGAGAATTAFFDKSFRLNVQLEQQMAQLTQILRTPSAAQSSYNQVVRTSTNTPFNMPDVLSSYIQMAQMGTNPNNRAFGIKAAANLGAGAQVPIGRATGALQQASLGYFTELNTLTGRNVRQTDFTYGGRYSGQTYQQAVMDVLKQYQNASQTQMQTFKGLMTNIQDIITQKLVIPAGAPVFGAVKGIEQQTAKTMANPQWQLNLSKEVDKLDNGLIKVFQLVKQGGAYFKSSLESPLKQVATSVLSLGAAFGQAFGGTVITGIKYIGTALATILTPVASLAKQLPVLAQFSGFVKALNMLGINVHPLQAVGDVFKGMLTLNPFRVLNGFRELFSIIGKFGTYELVKSFLDMKNANDQLDHSFKAFGKNGQHTLDDLKIGFDALIFRANELGKSVPQLKAYGAIAAGGVNPSIGLNKFAQVARLGSLDIAKLSMNLKMGGQDTAQVFQTWEKAMNATKAIQTGTSPRREVDTIYTKVYQAAELLSKTLGISLKDAAKDATVSLSLFSKQLNKAGLVNPRGASAAWSIYQSLSRPGGMSTGDYNQYGGPQSLTQQLLSNAVAPGVGVLQSALKQPGGLRRSFSLKSNLPNLHGAGTADIISILSQYANEPISSAAANKQMQGLFGGAAKALAPLGGINLPQFQNVLPQLGISTTASQVKGLNATQTAQEIVKLNGAINNVQNTLQSTNQAITRAQDNLSKLNIVTEQAQAAMAKFNLRVEGQQNAIDQWQINLQKLQINGLNPIQRALASTSQKMADYEHNSILPLQRAQEDWNQAMLMTSNRLEDVSFSMTKAQYNMELFNGGMLKGENALTAQIESLTVYNQKLDALRLQNMGLQADITKTQFHAGFTSTVKPLMGFDLSREIMLGQERAQIKQDTYDTTYGYQHWKLQRAARTRFQAQEMSFAQRMAGTTTAASQISAGTVETMAIQIQQYHEQLHSRKLEEAMYAATIKERPKQDEQYRLNRRAFVLQQKISIASDKIANATLGIQQAQLPIQHALNHIQNIATIQQAKIDMQLLSLNKKQGDLTNVVADLHALFGDYSKNFNNNIGTGGDSVLNHLKDIGKNMNLSREALGSILIALGGPGTGGGGNFGTGGQPQPKSGPGGVKGIWNMVTGLLNPLTWLQTGQDMTHFAAKSLGLPGPLATVLGFGTLAGGALTGLNAAHIMGAHVTGAAGKGFANVMGDRLWGGPAKFGNWLSDLREGAPWKALLHPSFYARSDLPGALAKLGTFGAFSAAGHPMLGVGAAAYADQMVSKISGKATFDEAGKYKHFVITKALFHFITSPIDSIKDWFHTVGNKMGEDMNKAATAAQATVDVAKVSGAGSLAEKLKGTASKPFIVAMMDGTRAGLGSLAAKIGINTDTGTAANVASAVRESVGAGVSSVKVSHEEKTLTADLKSSAKSFANSAQHFGKSVIQTTRDRISEQRGSISVAKETAKAADTNVKASHTFKEAARTGEETAGKVNDAAKIEHQASGTFRDIVKGKWATLTEDFAGKVGHFGRFVGRLGGVAAIFDTAATLFGDNTHFLNGIVRTFNDAVSFMGKLLHTFLGKITSLFDHLHIPGVRNPAAVSAEAARASTTAAEAARLNQDLSKSSGLRNMLDRAGQTSAKWIKIGGKVFRIAAKTAGALSFVPAAAEFVQGNVKQGTLDAVNAGEYFIPGLGEAKIATDALSALGLIPKGYQYSTTPGAPSLFDKAKGAVSGLFGGGQPTQAPQYGPAITQTTAQIKQMVVEQGRTMIDQLSATRKQKQQLIDQFNRLDLKQQQKFIGDSFDQQQQGLQSALTGPNGLTTFLDQQGSYTASAHSNILGATADMFNKQNKTTFNGFQAISHTTSGWLAAISKEIDTWAKNNGVPVSKNAGNVPAISGPSPQAIQAYDAAKTGQLIRLGMAHGGVVHADHHKVGPGKMVRMVEEGHPEVVIPLAPHRRSRAKSLLKKTAAHLGMAAGGYVFPFGGAVNWERSDQGVDFSMAPGTPIAAIGDSRLTSVIQNWYKNQPLLDFQFTSGPDAGKYWYVAEQIAPVTEAIGARFKAGQMIGRYAGSGTGIEIGWAADASGTTLANATTGYKEGQVTPAGANFRTFLQGLEHGKITAAPGFGGLAGKGTNPLSLKDVPAADLLKLGIVGKDQVKVLQHLRKKTLEHFNNQIAAPGSGSQVTSQSGPAIARQWTLAAMKLAGVGGNNWLNMLLRQESRESTFNPNSINLWDSNAKAGHPSKGILQMIDSTFSQYKLPGHDNIWNPVDNIAAAIEYMISRYGGGDSNRAVQVMSARGGGGYAGGLSRVPYDNFPAVLHQGETVLSSAQTNMRAGDNSKKVTELITSSNTFLKTIADVGKAGNSLLGNMESIANKQYMLSISALIKGAGPSVDHLKNLIGRDIGGHLKGAPSGKAGTQFSNLIDKLIAELHNFKGGVRIANAGMGKIFALDESSLSKLDKIIAEAGKGDRKDVISGLKALDATFKAHHEMKLEAKAHHILVQLQTHHITLKEAKKELEGLRADLTKKIGGESHLKIEDLGALLNKLQGLKGGKQTASVKHQEASLKTEILKLEKQFIKQEEKKGVSLTAIKYALAHVRSADNPTGILSDTQLRKIPSTLLKKAAGTKIGQYTAPSKTTKHIDHTLTGHAKTVANHVKTTETNSNAHAKATENHRKHQAKYAADRAKETSKYHASASTARDKAQETRGKHLQLAGGHYKNQEKTAGNHLALSGNHYKTAEGIASDHLKNAVDRLNLHTNHYKIHESTAGSHLRIASDHLSLSGNHFGKAETAQDKAHDQRNKHLGVFTDKMQKDISHQNRIENHFGMMINHLQTISNKIGNVGSSIGALASVPRNR